MSRQLRIAALGATVLFVVASLLVGARVAFAAPQSLFCHTYTGTAAQCQTYCFVTYGPDWGYHWNSGDGCCQCIF